MTLKLDGVQARHLTLANGEIRTYYRHRTTGMNLGHSGNEAAVLERYGELKELSKATLASKTPGSFAAALADYRASQVWASKATTTKDTWRRAMRRLEDLWGKLPLPLMSKLIASSGKESFIREHGPEGAKTMVAVARAVWSWLRQSGRTELENPFLRLGSFTTKDQRKTKREKKLAAIWREADVLAVLRAKRSINAGGNPQKNKGKAFFRTEATPPDIRMALLVGLFTCQRQTDILDLKAKQIVLRDKQLWWRLDQSKTDEFVGVPLHPVLAAELRRQEIEAGSNRLLVRAPISGERFDRRAFNRRWRLWLDAAQVRLTFQALRRSGMVWLAELGVPIPQIAAISGHSIARTTAIIDEYIPRTESLAREAMKVWARDTRLSPAMLLPE